MGDLRGGRIRAAGLRARPGPSSAPAPGLPTPGRAAATALASTRWVPAPGPMDPSAATPTATAAPAEWPTVLRAEPPGLPRDRAVRPPRSAVGPPRPPPRAGRRRRPDRLAAGRS